MQKRQANPKLPSKSLILIGSRQGTDGESFSSWASVRDRSSSCSVTTPPLDDVLFHRQVTRQWIIIGDTAVTRRGDTREAPISSRVARQTDARGCDGSVRQELAGEGKKARTLAAK
jgi:hypothetical protein